MDLLKSIAMVSLIMLLGYVSRKVNMLQKHDGKRLSTFVYHFALPALFFVNISRLKLFAIDPMLLLGSLAPIMLVLICLAGIAFTRLLTKNDLILYALTVVFGSNAFFGLAFFENFQGGVHFQKALISSSLLGIFGIIASLILFELTKKKVRAHMIIRQLCRNPLIQAIILGLIFAWFGFSHSVVHDALGLLGRTATGLAIFILGIFIYDHFSWKAQRQACWISVFRGISLPLAGIATIALIKGYWPDMSGELPRFLLLQTGIPAAVSLGILAERYRFKIKEITGMVLITSIGSGLVLGLLYIVAGKLYQ